jgi:hypothetical protein
MSFSSRSDIICFVKKRTEAHKRPIQPGLHCADGGACYLGNIFQAHVREEPQQHGSPDIGGKAEESST